MFLKDFAEVEVVPLLNLQLLDPNFLHTRDGAIKCHLAGIQAAGDKPEWPGLACEYLAEQITKYPNIYITKKVCELYSPFYMIVYFQIIIVTIVYIRMFQMC